VRDAPARAHTVERGGDVRAMRITGHALAVSLVLLAAPAAYPQTAGRSLVLTQHRAPPAPSTPASMIGFTPAKIEVFVTNGMFVVNAPATAHIYRVDDRQKLEADLTGNGLPPDRAAAQRIVMQRVQQMGKQAFDARIRNAMDAVQQSVQLGIDRVPAIVFDGKHAVFGITDVAQALDITRRGGALPVRARFKSAPPIAKTPPAPPAYLQPQAVRQLPPAVRKP
jgi:integrating conjugative element protein (TIGR03757 family)